MHKSPPAGFWKKAWVLAACTGLFCALAVSHSRAGRRDLSEADQKAFAGYHLTMEKLDKFDATNKKIAAAANTDPALAKELATHNALNSGTTLDDALSQFDARAPHFAAVLKGAGMTDRDYVLTLFSVMLMQSGLMLKEYAPDKPLPPYIPADNVALAEKNRTRFQEITTNLEHLNTKPRKHQDEDEAKSED